MKILFNYYSGGGGGLSNILMLIRAMSFRYPNDQIYVCSSKADFSSLQALRNVTICSFPEGSHGEVARLKFSVRGLQKLAKDLGVDVIWSMNLGAYMRGDCPQVLSINNAYQVYPINSLRLHPAGVFRAMLLRFFSFLSIRASSAVIVQTDVMRRQLLFNVGPVDSVLVSPKSVENDFDTPRAELSAPIVDLLGLKLGGQAFTFLYVATAFPHKNHRIILDVFSEMKGRGIDMRLVLTVSYDEIVSVGGDIARELVNSGHVVPVGWVSREQIRSLYQACDACVMPSLLESLSSAHLEAMAWQRPQVVSDLPYARELCGEAAIYADPHSAEDWVEKLIKLSAEPGLRSRLVENGLSRIKEFPKDWSEAAQVTRDFIKSVALVDN